MEFLSAFSSLERIAIIAAAIVIGYWGFRLFATDRTPGLIFMGVACAVLVAVLVTGGRHIQSVSRSLQTATPTAETEPLPGPSQQLQAPPPAGPPVSAATVEQVIQPASEATAEQDLAVVDTPAANAGESAAEATDILGGRDLGGRIISVKSDTVTLEWEPPSD